MLGVDFLLVLGVQHQQRRVHGLDEVSDPVSHHSARDLVFRSPAQLDLLGMPAFRGGDDLGVRGECQDAGRLAVLAARQAFRHVAVDDNPRAHVQEQVPVRLLAEVTADGRGLADTWVALQGQNV